MKSNKTIIIDDAVPFANEMFSHLGKVITLPGKEIKNADLKQANAVIVRSRTQVNKNLLKNTSVTFVGSTIVGLDHIDQNWLKSNHIKFYSAQGCNANSVAEFIMACLFQIAEQKKFNLNEKTLGIVGVGHVGKLVHQKANILGIKTLLNDPPRQRVESNTSFVNLKTVLSADIITLHTPLSFSGTDKTYHLVNEQNFKYISSETILLNAARGGIVDETIWTQTPTKANIIDCWENEPYICSDMYQATNCATPHIAGHSLEAKVSGSKMVYHALCNFWNKTPQTQWQSQLPPPPPNITINNTNQSDQAIICQILTHAHNPKQDDQAIRSENILTVQKNFETYRRNYPVYREWNQHKLTNAPKHLKPCLIKLGFICP